MLWGLLRTDWEIADYRIIDILQIWSWVAVGFTVSQELLLLSDGDSSGTQRTEKVRLWKQLPEDWWRDSRPRRPCACCSELQSAKASQWIVIKDCKCQIRPPLWSSGQNSRLQIRRPGFDSQSYHIFWEVVGLTQGPLSLVSTTEELLGRKSSSSGLESREYGGRNPSRWPRGTLYPQKLALTSPTNGGRSVGIFRSRTQTTEFF
jgi:hypothetical protein